MPTEKPDVTRVEPIIKFPAPPTQIPPEPDQLYDKDKVQYYENMQNFVNNNFLFGRPTNYNPSTSQAAIQANFDYATQNAKNFAEILALAGVGEVATWATTPVKIGEGAEAVVTSAPISARVTKVTSIPRTEMHIRNTVPNALKSRYVGTQNGLTTYTQPKVKILSKEQLSKARTQLEKLMTKHGWRKVTHPNLQGEGYTNGRWVISDLGEGNIGMDWLRRLRLPDFSLETVPEFRLAMRKKGGKL